MLIAGARLCFTKDAWEENEWNSSNLTFPQYATVMSRTRLRSVGLCFDKDNGKISWYNSRCYITCWQYHHVTRVWYYVWLQGWMAVFWGSSIPASISRIRECHSWATAFIVERSEFSRSRHDWPEENTEPCFGSSGNRAWSDHRYGMLFHSHIIILFCMRFWFVTRFVVFVDEISKQLKQLLSAIQTINPDGLKNSHVIEYHKLAQALLNFDFLNSDSASNHYSTLKDMLGKLSSNHHSIFFPVLVIQRPTQTRKRCSYCG